MKQCLLYPHRHHWCASLECLEHSKCPVDGYAEKCVQSPENGLAEEEYWYLSSIWCKHIASLNSKEKRSEMVQIQLPALPQVEVLPIVRGKSGQYKSTDKGA